MQALNATYEWNKPSEATSSSSTSIVAASTVAPSVAPPPAVVLTGSHTPTCQCATMSPAEKEVQLLKAKAELALLRDRVRKISSMLFASEFRSTTPIRFIYEIEPEDLVRHLCFWQHTSALTRVGLTPVLAELTSQYRKLQENSPEPPASKNKLTLVVWNLVHLVRRLRLLEAKRPTNNSADAIVVRISDLVPIWTWEADLLRHRPQLTRLCDRMLSMEFFLYRQECELLSLQELVWLDRGERPTFTPLGLRWPPSALPTLQRSIESEPPSKRKVFDGETFCVSGSFSVSQKKMLALLRDNGGAIAANFNRKCTYVVANDMGSAKTTKAEAKGIPIVTEDWVHASIAQGEKATDASLFLGEEEEEEDGEEEDDEDDDDSSYASEESDEEAESSSAEDSDESMQDDNDAFHSLKPLAPKYHFPQAKTRQRE